jgi:putative lipoic acid-binding regulatory protein
VNKYGSAWLANLSALFCSSSALQQRPQSNSVGFRPSSAQQLRPQDWLSTTTMNMNGTEIDILVLGATGARLPSSLVNLCTHRILSSGFTGKLISRHLSSHPSYDSGRGFRLALGARSQERLDALFEQLAPPEQVKKIVVDVTSEESLRSAIAKTNVVVNTVGPFAKWSTPVVA